MKHNEVQRHMIRYQGEIDHLGYLLDRAKNALPTDFEGYRHYTHDAARMAERITCSLRDFVVETCFVTKKEVLEQAAEEHGVTIAQEDGWVKITLPGLLPKKKGGSCRFIADPMSAALISYGQKNSIERFRHAVVCFRHLYSSTLPERAVRDNDNFETKQVLDVIADHLLEDDNGLLCSNLYISDLGESEGTEVYVMPPEKLGEWLDLHPIKTL